MSRMTRITERTGWIQDCNSMLVSALCNLTGLVVLGLLTAASDNDGRGVKLLVNVGEGDSAVLDDSPLEDAVELQVAADPAAALGPVQLFDDVAVPTADVSA